MRESCAAQRRVAGTPHVVLDCQARSAPPRRGLSAKDQSMSIVNRRRLLAAGLAMAALPHVAPRALAAALLATPAQTAGPFYPPVLPLDHDNDLVRVTGHPAEAMGMVAHLGGRLLLADGRPVGGARIEIWQCDANGRYRHPAERGRAALDEGFQGFGATMTAADGGYRFRTIRPVAYSGRAPHIHVAILAPGQPPLVTQLYVAGDAANARDGVFRSIDPAVRPAVEVAFVPAPELEAGALMGRIDLVLPG